MELSFRSPFVVVSSRSMYKSSRRYVQIQRCCLQELTGLDSGADSCLSTAAKHVLHVKCLGNTMRCWDCIKYLECLQAAPMLKERLAPNSSGIKQIPLPSVPHIPKCLSVPGEVCVS